ncbi:hypothetical protein OUZ56_017533 [Daphnia magna]|uniref:Uncharacterized protein n=1 Tax=Daphnia magna TaxID=35525 RepID=A0ABR0ASZ7_9CRUS|nr:hypothetical protein OUZ56_017533 [Daphnia magna]
MILLPNGCRSLLLLGFVSPVLYFSSLFRSALPQRSTARPRPPLGCTPDLGYPPTTPCHEPSPSVSDSLPAPYVLLSYHLLPAILAPPVSCRTLRLPVHFSASCQQLWLTVHFSDSCRKLRLTVHCPDSCRTLRLTVTSPLLAELFGSRFTAPILAEHFGSRSLLRFLTKSSAHGSLPRFLPNTSAHGHFSASYRTLRLTVHCPDSCRPLRLTAHGFCYPRSLNVPVCPTLALFTVFPPASLLRYAFPDCPTVGAVTQYPINLSWVVDSQGSLTATASAAQNRRETQPQKRLTGGSASPPCNSMLY